MPHPDKAHDAPSPQSEKRDLGKYIQGNRFVKKREFRNKPKYIWKFWPRLRTSKAAREKACYDKMAGLGVPCPSHVKVREWRNWLGMLNASEISMDYLPNTVDLRYIALDPAYACFREDPHWRKQVLEQLAHWVRVMHEHHFYPLNLHFRNILVDPELQDKVELYFIDCMRGDFQTGAREREFRIKDLAYLYKDARTFCTLREQVRFAHLLFDSRKLVPEQRLLLREVATLVKSKWGNRSSTLAD